MVQWLRDHLPCNAGDVGSIPNRGTKIPHGSEQLSLHAATKTQHSQIKKKEEEYMLLRP